MKPRPFAALGLLLLCSATWTQVSAQQPWRPPTAPVAPPAASAGARDRLGRPLHYYDGVPDTGQFLPDSVVVGRIDGRVFRVGEFRDRWLNAHILYRPKPDSAGRLEFLNSMVNKEVLAGLAREANRPLGFEDRAVLRETRQRALSNAAFARLVADSITLTQEDLQHIYDQGKSQLHVQHIVTNDQASAEQARDDVLGRRLSWEQAVQNYSTHRGDQGPYGEVGWVQRASFDYLPALEIFDLPDSALSGVFRGADGWEVVRVVGRRPAQQPAFDFMRHLLEAEGRSTRLARRGELVRERIRQRIGMTYDDANISWAAIPFREQARPEPSKPGELTIDLGADLPDFQPTDTARVLARWRDGQLTLGSFLQAYGALPVLTRTKIGGMQTLRVALDDLVLEPYVARFASEQGLDDDPLVLEAVAKKEEEIRVEHLFADSVQARVSVTPEERRQYFQERETQYTSWETVTFAALVRHSKGGADSLAARLKAGESAAAILRADSLAGVVSGSVQELREDDSGPLRKLLFEELRPGGVEVTGPDRLGDYLVLQKLTHEPRRQLRLQDVESLVDESVQNLKAEELLKQLIARHRPRHDVELHPELLMRIILSKPEE